MKYILKKSYLLLLIPILVYADQATKLLAERNLKGQADYPLLPGILEFSYLENRGAAFSSFMGMQGFLITLTSIVMLLLLFKFFQIPEGKRYLLMRITFVLIISGGIGNLIDRVINRYVIDFIYFVPIDFPKFNIADCYVSVGMVLMCIICFFYYKDDEINFLFTLKGPASKEENK